MPAHESLGIERKQAEARVDLPAFGVAALAAGHGIMEYMQKANMTALAVGVGFGGALALSGYRTTYDKNDTALGLLSSAGLAAVKGKQFYDTQKLPYGVVAGAAVLLMARYGAHYFGFTDGKK